MLWSDPFRTAEVILFFVVLIVGSTLRSTLITSNDLGWRAWLPGQFILLIWGVDTLENLSLVSKTPSPLAGEVHKNRRLMIVFLAVGIITTIADAALLRFAWPLMTGPEVTRQYYSAHLAYDYLRENAPADAITQNNPSISLDRPSGLYGTHQMVISDRTMYGISTKDFDKWAARISPIFNDTDMMDWQLLDPLCAEYSIDILIFADVDPVWRSLDDLKAQRLPLYENEHYIIFSCGE